MKSLSALLRPTLSFLRKAAGPMRGGARKSVVRKPVRRGLALEPLEDRTVPSTLVVTTLLDEVHDGDGVLSLREALRIANDDTGGTSFDGFSSSDAADTIEFHESLTDGTIFIQTPDNLEPLTISSNVTIKGPGAGHLTIDSSTSLFRSTIFGVTQPSGSPIPTVAISGLTLTGVDNAFGAPLNNAGTLTLTDVNIVGNRGGGGGAIFNQGTLRIEDSWLAGNTASFGGAIYNTGILRVVNSAFTANNAVGGHGGAIYNAGITYYIINSTLSGNKADGSGAAIWTSNLMDLANSTVVGNRADADGNGTGQGGGIFTTLQTGSTDMDNTLVAGNFVGVGNVIDDLAGKDPSGVMRYTGGSNLIGEIGIHGTLQQGVNGNIVGVAHEIVVDPNLADNGGRTPTHALRIDGPAIDAGDNRLALAGYDQRREPFPRIFNGRVDIGAYEYSILPPVAVDDPSIPGDPHYATNRNTMLHVDAAHGVLVNDYSPDPTQAVFVYSNTNSVHGAQVVVQPDGSFTYDPSTLTSTSIETDTFTYSISNLPAATTAGADFFVEAAQDVDADDRWEDLVGTSGLELLLASGVTRMVGVSDLPGISAAYDFPGGSLGNEGGALLVAQDTTLGRSFQHAPGDWSNDDVTIEIWFEPDNLNPGPGIFQTLFEDGGGQGLGFYVGNNALVYRKQPSGGLTSFFNLSSISSEFIQAVGTYRVSTGEIQLFVNGVPAGTDVAPGNDWSGGDNAAIGTLGGANAGGFGSGQQNTQSFDGRISLFRIYHDRILTGSEVHDNYRAIAGPENGATATVTIALTGSNQPPIATDDPNYMTDEDSVLIVPAAEGVVANDSDPDGDVLQVVGVGPTALGGVVAMQADGSFTYDPDGLFEYLAEGETATDRFTYTIADPSGETAEATVTLTIHGRNDGPAVASPQSIATNEDAPGFNIDLLAGAYDPDASDILSVGGLTLLGGDPSGVTASGDSLSVDPNAYNHLAFGESEVIDYAYDILDGRGGSVCQTARIVIEGRNDAPRAGSFTKTGAEDNVIAFAAADFLAAYSDPDGDALKSIRIESLSGDGTLLLAGVAVGVGQVIDASDFETLTFVPDLNFAGVTGFGFSVGDGLAFSVAPATATLNILSAAQQVDAVAVQVDALLASGTINEGQAESLKLTLRGNHGDIGKVQAFLHQLEGFVLGGILTEEEARSLFLDGRVLLNSVRTG